MTFGLFESAISSEQEVGLARQAAADTFNAAVYDVRDKLGPALFTSSSLEEFRDRVAMMKTDQSLYKIIGAHVHPGASVVRRIAGRGGVLEKEFKRRLNAELNVNTPGIANAGAGSSPNIGADNSLDAIGMPGTQHGTFNPTPTTPSAAHDQVNTAVGQGILNPSGGGNLNQSGGMIQPPKLPTPPKIGYHLEKEFKHHLADNMSMPDMTPDNPVAPTATTPSAPQTGIGIGNGGASMAGTPNVNSTVNNLMDNMPHSPSPANKAMTPTARRHRAADSTVDVKGQFSPSDGELEPEGNFKGYLKSMEQGTPAKVDSNCFADGTNNVTEHTGDPAKELFAAKTAFNIYRDWCASNQMSPMRLSSLDSYAVNLPDAHYMKLAGIIQAWDNEHKPKTPQGQSKSKLRDVTAGDHSIENYPRDSEDKMYRGDPTRYNDPAQHPDTYGQAVTDETGARRNPPLPPHVPQHEATLRRYIAWCDRNGLKRISARNVNHFAKGDPETCIMLAKRMKNAIRIARQRQAKSWENQQADRDDAIYEEEARRADRWHNRPNHEPGDEKWNTASRRRTAAPDYLQKAQEALTQLLNQKAQEFQDTIAPLQQALVTVQQATQLQQAQNPMNVLPPPGTVNVMPGGDQGPVGLPAPGSQDLGAAVQALAGGAGDQVPPAGGPPPPGGGGAAAGAPAAGGGGDQGGPPPAAQDPSQMTARRRRAAMPPDYDTTNGQYAPDENDPYQDEHHHDDYYKDTGDMFYGPGKDGPKWSRDFANQKHAVYGDSPDMYDEYNREPSYDSTPHPDDAHDQFHSFDADYNSPDDPNAGGHHVVHAPGLNQAVPKKGRGASRPLTGATVHDLWNHWQQQNGGMGGQPDYDRFAQEMHVGPQAIQSLQKAHGFGGMPV